MAAPPTARKPTFSTPVLILAGAGVRLDEIADALGRSRAHVSKMLAGDTPSHPELIETIRTLAGPEVAQRVTDAIPARQAS